MNATAINVPTLLDRLPKLRGSYAPFAALAPFSWFRVGGPADVLFRPADEDDLAAFLAKRPSGLPLTVLGAASNVLIRDGGVRGVVIRLGKGFTGIEILGGHRVKAGAAALDAAVARHAAKAGIAGLEFLVGIPGTVGGALRMNAGAYGRETKDVLIEAYALTNQGERVVFTPDELNFSYRHCGASEDLIFTAALFAGGPGNPAEISKRMDEIAAAREQSQPIRTRTGGSTFKNPPGAKAWELIDKAGCRGQVRGDAQVSAQHCNFLINRGAASAADLEDLGEDVRTRVFHMCGIKLDWEIKRLGERLPRREAGA
jgi:UDP-N-acetylmuramate dehydrogenase